MRKKLSACLLSVFLLTIALPVASANGSSGYILIVRDNYGVPHIFSNTKEGLGFGCGYAMAQDRLWQADLFRRQSFGSLAEFGLATIEQDYQTRKLGYSREELLEIFDNWVPTQPKTRLKEMALAFVDGVNLYISEALEAYAIGDPSLMPIEYLPNPLNPYGFPLEPWTIEDTVAIVVMMAWRFGGTGGGELGYAARLQALQATHGEELGWLMFNDLYPQDDPGAEVTIPSTGCWYPIVCGSSPELPSNIGGVYKEYEEARTDQTQLFESLGLPTKFGSNAWIVSPWKSKSRNALQVGGPQMGHSIPQIVLEIGLHGAGINAVGMMMPMLPTILIGVSECGAWTSTTGGSDVMDTYMEVLNPENQYQYLYNGEWVDMEKRTERIYGPLKTYYEDRDVYRTVHGPIIGWDLDSNLAFTMKTPYYKNELAAEEGWSLFQQARNIWEMQEACETVQPNHNFFWTDKHGNIGYWHAGTFPIKPTYGKDGRLIDDRFPLWGTGEEEWLGVTGFEEMPKCINPKQGWLTNWNNKPIANWPYGEADWGEGHRVKRIQELLAAGGKISFEDMNTINMDAGYNHIPGMNFLHYLIEAASTSGDPDVAAALSYLEAWDHHHYIDLLDPKYPDLDATYDDPGLTIFERWYQKIKNEVFGDDLPGMGASDSTLIHVFDGPDSKLPLCYDYLNGEDRDEVIVRVLKEALDELEAEHGPEMSAWLTPVIIITFAQLGALPPPTMHGMNRGTYNHIAEMRRRSWWWKPSPHAVNVIPPGQSGFMNLVDGMPNISPHAYDQLPLYETWTYKPMLFRFWDIWKVAESWMILPYA
jgi:penicillin amidase